jgi:hypothetical protein
MPRALACTIAFITIIGASAPVPAQDGPPVALFAHGDVAAYLDLTDDAARSLDVVDATNDFLRCFELMTGSKLPRAGGEPALFDPTGSETTRFECAIADISDASTFGGPNATVAIAVSPTLHFDRDPLAGPGEKVVWSGTWDRSARTFSLNLTVANQGY